MMAKFRKRTSACLIGLIVLSWLYFYFGIIFFSRGVEFKKYLMEDYAADYLKEVRISKANTTLYTLLSPLIIIYLVLTCVFVLGCSAPCFVFKRWTSFILIVIIWTFVVMQVYALTLHKDITDDNVATEMKNVLVHRYHGDNGTDRITRSINTLFMKFNCCEVDNYKDLQRADWTRHYKIDVLNSTLTLEAPYLCCKGKTNRFDRVAGFGSRDIAECAINPSTTTSNYMNGCYTELHRQLDNLNLHNILCIALEVLTILIVLFFCKINPHLFKEDKDKAPSAISQPRHPQKIVTDSKSLLYVDAMSDKPTDDSMKSDQLSKMIRRCQNLYKQFHWKKNEMDVDFI